MELFSSAEMRPTPATEFAGRPDPLQPPVEERHLHPRRPPPQRAFLSSDDYNTVSRLSNFHAPGRPSGEVWIIQCAPMARFTSGGRIHPESCRLALVADERHGRATGRVEAS